MLLKMVSKQTVTKESVRMFATGFRTEADTFGPLEVKADRYWGA